MQRLTLAALARRCLPVFALFLASTVQAQYFWIDRDATGQRISMGELGKPDPAVPAVQHARAFTADGSTLELSSGEGGYRTPGVSGDLRFTAQRADDKSLTIYHARAGRQETKAVSDLELVPTSPGGNTFRLFWKGTAVSASLVNVSTSEGWSRTLRAGSDGTISLQPLFPALYVLEVSAKVNGAVTVDGKKYEDVRHVATLSFRVDR